jgi:PiT family inorganic phosphate transporter
MVEMIRKSDALCAAAVAVYINANLNSLGRLVRCGFTSEGAFKMPSWIPLACYTIAAGTLWKLRIVKPWGQKYGVTSF